MIQMKMVTGDRKPTHVMAATSICDEVNKALAELQEGYSTEDIRRVETHLTQETELTWIDNHFEEGFIVYQYIAFIWVNE